MEAMIMSFLLGVVKCVRTCPKGYKITNFQYLKKELSDYVNSLLAVRHL